MWRRGHIRWHDFPAEFHENIRIGSDVISGGQTERQTFGQKSRKHVDLIIFTFQFKETRLKLSIAVPN
jgi:hypothetical protein